jgi:hypothetical protein
MTNPAAKSREEFERLISTVTSQIAGRDLDQRLEEELNQLFPHDGAGYKALLSTCQAAIAEGWMCAREAGGIRFGRVIKAGPETHGFSVDVVDMQPTAGPHHRHPNGEIDLVMPLEPEARFDSRGAGWLVYGPDSAHRPTVTVGRALVLYLLPAGAIEFNEP